MFVMGLGEELWKRFLPRYLQQLGAPVVAIGTFGTAMDFLDGVYQYPGGWVADTFGRRTALYVFVAAAMMGYIVYYFAPSWPWIFVGLVFTMAWTAMASPTLFAVVGDALPKGRRAMGFTVQSILRRVPIVNGYDTALGIVTLDDLIAQMGSNMSEISKAISEEFAQADFST